MREPSDSNGRGGGRGRCEYDRAGAGAGAATRPSAAAAAAIVARAVLLEALEARRLLCFDHVYDNNGIEVTTDGFEPVTPADLAASAPPAAAAANGIPDLHSRPGAPVSIYMDFDGHGSTAPYSEDADAATFNPAEIANIAEAWEELSTYFAMFDADVTTTQPAAGARVSWVAIGNNISGGYAYVGTFPMSSPFAFNNSGHARDRVSGIAHEIGHTFGLWHQSDYDQWGTRTKEYTAGFDNLHRSIMGIDYLNTVAKWFNYHGSSATSLQDDMATIANRIKAYAPAGSDGYRPDDFADTIAAAAALTLDGGSTAPLAGGVIERITDVDAFSFTLPAGHARTTLRATPFGVSGVDLRLSLYDADGALVAVKDDSATNAQPLGLTLAGGRTYYALVAGDGNYGDVGRYELSIASLPQAWATQDVGAVPLPGSAGYRAQGNAFELNGSGRTISSTHDELRFTYQTMTGDGAIVARVDSITDHNYGHEVAGVMFRESLAADARFASTFASIDNAYDFMYRAATGANMIGHADWETTIPAPMYVRLQRSGNTFSAAKSGDGVNWTDTFSATVAMPPTLYVGLFMYSADPDETATAVFSNVGLSGAVAPVAPPSYNALPAPANLAVAPAASGTGFGLTWSDLEGEGGYAIARSPDGAAYTEIATVGANVTSYADAANLGGGSRYFYRVSATNGTALRSAPSAAASAINRPGAVPNLRFMSQHVDTAVIDWRDVEGETGYRVERSADNGASWATVATLGPNIPSYTNAALAHGALYSFRVTPFNDAGDGAAQVTSGQTRLPSVTGLAFASVRPSEIRITWNGNVTQASSYRLEKSSDGGTTYATLATLPAGTTAYTDAAVAPMSRYAYRIVALSAKSQSMLGSIPTIMTSTPSANPLPLGWASVDIGSNEWAGAAELVGGTATLFGDGSPNGNFTNTPDAFRFLFQRATGDGDLVARLVSHEAGAANITAGIMIRASLSSTAQYAMIGAGATRIGTSYRTSPNGLQNHLTAAAPMWLKLARAGSTYTASYSADGASWTTLQTLTIPMGGGELYVGLAVGSVDGIDKATFDNLGGSLLNQPDTVAPGAPAISAISADTGASVVDKITSDNTLVLSGNAHSASTVTITRTGVGVIGQALADANGQWSFDYTAVALPDGAHAFTATARDAWDNVSPASAPVTVTIDTAAPAITGWKLNPTAARVEVQFSEQMASTSMSSGDLTLTALSADGTPGGTWQLRAPTYDPATRTMSYELTSDMWDGRWQVSMASGKVTDHAGNANASASSFAYFFLAAGAAADTVSVRRSGGNLRVQLGTAAPFAAPLGTPALIDLGAGVDDLHLDFAQGDFTAAAPDALGVRAHETLRVTGTSAADAFTVTGATLTRAATGAAFPLGGVTLLDAKAGAFTLAENLGVARGLGIGALATVRARATQVLASLTLAPDAALDLDDHDLILNWTTGGSPLAALSAALGNARNETAGARITSTAAGGYDYRALGIADAADVLDFSLAATQLWGGQTVDATSVLIKFTYAADANLDGRVDGGDYAYIDAYVGSTGGEVSYLRGDFNFDGYIDGGDYAYIDYLAGGPLDPM